MVSALVLVVVGGPLWGESTDRNKRLAAGKALYFEACASCHGNDGSGSQEGYAEPLVGDFSIGELTQLVERTMPEGEPETIVGQDAANVALYIHESFYGPAAQLKARAPEKTLSRLTGDQLRQCAADLYGHFHPMPKRCDDRGLWAEYVNGVRWNKNAKKVERVDATIDFDFGREDPVPGVSAGEFRISWSGALIPPRSGRYELVLRSSCSCELYFERPKQVLVNNRVQSEGRDEFRVSRYLIGGRPYLFELHFYQKKRKTEQPPASVSVSWVPPGGVEQIVPKRYWMPRSSGSHYTLQSKLPPDDRSYGYERGTSIDPAWDQSITRAAIELGSVTAAELYPPFRQRELRKNSDDENRRVLRAFLKRWLQVAFRGPLDEATQRLYLDRHLDASEDDATAIKRAVLMAMKSPRFLYPYALNSGSRSQRAASALTLTLYDSLPSDAPLLTAIEKGQLKDERSIRRRAERMIDDDRCRAKIREFLYHWLELESTHDLTKNAELYPGFDRALVEDLRMSLDHFLDTVVHSPESDFRELVSADWTITNDRLHRFYGDAWAPAKPGSAPDSSVALSRTVSDPAQHVGVLTHPLLMSDLAYHETSSPIHRGVFLLRRIMGRVLRPPNAAFTPLDPKLRPDLTTRQRVELQTGEVNCQVCHQKINGLGFAMENFDAVGRFRSIEQSQTIDASGRYISRNDDEVQFRGAREFGDYVANSEDSQRAFVEAAFEYFVKQPIGAFGTTTADDLYQRFRESEFNIRELILEISVIAACDHAFDDEAQKSHQLTAASHHE